MQEVAEARGKTVPQVNSVFVTLHLMIVFTCLVAGTAASVGTATLVLVAIQISYLQAGGIDMSVLTRLCCLS